MCHDNAGGKYNKAKVSETVRVKTKKAVLFDEPACRPAGCQVLLQILFKFCFEGGTAKIFGENDSVCVNKPV